MNRFDYIICTNCFKGLPLINESYCIHCGRIVQGYRNENYICPECRAKRPPYSRLFVLGQYTGTLRELIIRYKFWGKNKLGKFFAALIIERYEKILKSYNIEIIVPIPLHFSRFIERGFNQSQVIATILARHFKWKLINTSLIRRRKTEPQALLKKKDRIENIKGSFTVQRPEIFKDKVLLIIDDIYTTGYTLKEAAKEIKKCKPKDLFALVVARS